jgi:hypothetical protein
MSDRYPILRSLDPHHARIGYLGALSTVGIRSLDTTEALKSRFHDLLFERIYPQELRFGILKARLTGQRWRELEKRLARSAAADPSAILSDAPQGEGWAYLSEFWLYDSRMPSSLGQLSVDQLDRTIDLARWAGVLLPTGELSEVGFLLQHLLSDCAAKDEEKDFNLLFAQARPALPLLYLRLILSAEMLSSFLIRELVERQSGKKQISTRGEHGLLRAAVKRMLESIGEPDDPADILAMRDVSDFQAAILAKASTEENYLRPRLEILVDLALIDRKPVSGKSRTDFMWIATETTERLASEWAELGEIGEYLDRSFFCSMGRVYARELRKVTSVDEMMLWFARAFLRIGRDFGFTPGRSCALLACLIAWESGAVMEIAEVFDAVYEAGRSKWSRFLHFSGGSRFDKEFLIRVDQEAVAELEKAVKKPSVERG